MLLALNWAQVLYTGSQVEPVTQIQEPGCTRARVTPPCETVSGMMIARIETSRRLQDNWIEQVEDHNIIREEVPRYKYARYKASFSALSTECLYRDFRENFICASSPLEPPETCTRV